MLLRPGRLIALAALALVFLGGPSAVGFYTDWLWFGEVGYPQIFAVMLRGQSTMFTAGFVLVFLWMSVNLRIALATIGDTRPVFTTREGIEITLPGRRQLQTLAIVIAAVIGLVAGLVLAGRWETWLAWRNAVPFNEADPVLGYDAGFYVFTLPLLQLLRSLGQTLVVLAALASGGLYLVTGSLTTGFPARFAPSPGARRHLALLAAAFMVLLALGAWLSRAEHLIETSGMFQGASYADVHGRMPAALALVGVALVGALLAVVHAVTTRNWPIPAAAVLYLVVAIGGEGYSRLLQQFVVSPNEQAREEPFIGYNIAATRRAFGLDTVEQRQLSGDATLTAADISANSTTLDNVRLWDHAPLLQTFGQIQEIRTYYDFMSIDNDRYTIGGVPRQVMLSVRELNSASLPNRTWVNERLTFTHGYGMTLGPVNEVTDEGLPVLFIRDMPPQTIPDLPVKESSVYFGELSNDYVIVGTSTPEFHYPRGDQNETTTYTGKGGLSLDSLWRKVLFALRFRAYQIVLNDGIGPDSRILFNRNIQERLTTLAPFLRFDGDPYAVLVNGRLFWISDAYTVSSLYPYATRFRNSLNYIRNSVKIVIDSYDGTTTAYLADNRDPIAATYARIFPGVFKPLSEMPSELRAHVRYPEDIFAIQSQVFATYHMTQPSVFYNREDQWEIPSVDESREQGAIMQPYYTIMRLPGEKDPEFIQMLPFTPRNRDNLAAWLVARSDGEHYGSLRVFEFPKQKLVFGPRQVISRIAQDQEIAPQITLWNQQGSRVIWGTLMVIPIEESLIYVRPLYLQASSGRIPELTRVIVGYQNQIVMEETLAAALARLFGNDGGAGEAPSTTAAAATPGSQPADPADTSTGTALQSLAAEARSRYERAVEAQRAGDWATYGEQIRLLGQTLERMRQAR